MTGLEMDGSQSEASWRNAGHKSWNDGERGHSQSEARWRNAGHKSWNDGERGHGSWSYFGHDDIRDYETLRNGDHDVEHEMGIDVDRGHESWMTDDVG